MGKEFAVETLEDMCSLMCDNRIPAKKKKKPRVNIQEILDEIMELAEFHSSNLVSMDGNIEKVVSLAELGQILDEIKEGMK